MKMGFACGSIELVNSSVFYSGQVINGRITFRLDESIMISALNIQFYGAAEVLWTEQETEKRQGATYKTRVDYKGQEEYFNSVQCLLGGQGPIPLNAGPHSIPFHFQLPFNVPSSFKDDLGKVFYEIRAFLEYPEVTKEREGLQRTFSVVAPIDLNKVDPRLKDPLKISFDGMYNGGCMCAPRSLAVEVEAPVSGFCPGQTIPIKVDARNDTNNEIKAVKVQIIGKKRFQSEQPVSSRSPPEEELVSVETAPVLCRSQRLYTVDLTLPAFLAPNLQDCKLIDVQFFFRATVKMTGFNDDLVETVPIVIGLKPLANFTEYYEHPMADSLPVGPIPDYKPPAVPVNSPYPTGSNENARAVSTSLNSSYPTGSNLVTPGFVVPSYRPKSPGYPKLAGDGGDADKYVPQQYPLNGHVPVASANYNPTAPPM